jgi:hypothetical protein
VEKNYAYKLRTKKTRKPADEKQSFTGTLLILLLQTNMK